MIFPQIFIRFRFLFFIFFLVSVSLVCGDERFRRAPQQLDFSLKVGERDVAFTYVWMDSLGVRHVTAFSLLKSEVKVGLGEFSAVGEDWEEGIRELFLAKMRPILDRLGMEIEVRGGGSNFSYVLTGPSGAFDRAEEVKQSIPTLYQLSREEFARSRYYVGKEEANRFLLRPDYEALVRRYIGVSRPLAEVLGKGAGDSRGVSERFLDFVQSIPYSRDFTNKAEFQTPVGCYAENRGDCDTKSVALASLLSVYGIPWVIVALPEHMVLGVGVRAKPGEEVLVDRGASYVLVEPAGSGYSFGKLAPTSLSAIQLGDYFLLR